MIKQPHFHLVTLPAQGHINHSLQFAKRLMLIDGYDDGIKPQDNRLRYMYGLKRRGSQTLSELIVDSAKAKPIPSSLWIQPAAVFDIYFYHFNGYGDIFSNCKDTSNVIALPGLPQFSSRGLPSFLLPSNTYATALQLLQEQPEQLSQETNQEVLVNSFDALELGAMNATEKFNLIGIEPLIPSDFLDGKDPLDKSFGGDLFQGSEDYTEWWNSKPKSSVVCVSSGSILVLSNRQMEEISRWLVRSRLPFLLVIRDGQNKKKEKWLKALRLRGAWIWLWQME
ncbi:hypothetical protein SADUNF_Sadunf14G0110100 [Salix dunnii]|uniref:Uncharacterized protein n=1 Tax=Salix dunnii TaxID=1413687 RepID=A0A835JGW2_9ROSI|nr:hypothetical protein SADUNF_Sadunf14G0110100 [Salix dunnii]